MDCVVIEALVTNSWSEGLHPYITLEGANLAQQPASARRASSYRTVISTPLSELTSSHSTLIEASRPSDQSSESSALACAAFVGAIDVTHRWPSTITSFSRSASPSTDHSRELPR